MLVLGYLSWTLLGLSNLCFAQNLNKLQQAASGIAISGGSTPFSVSFGSVNGLGIGTPTAGLTKLAVTGGELYYTPYTIVVGGVNGGHPALVKAYLSTPLTNGSSVLQLLSCPYPNPCSTYGSYSALQSGQTNEISVLPSQTANGNYTAYLGLFVWNVNGGITASDTAQITFDCYDANNNKLQNSVVLNLSPNLTIATAVQLQLATAASGITISGTGSSADYTASFGNVNGLGVKLLPGTGLSIVTGQVSNGSLYATPYTISPAFSGFNTTSGTNITVYSGGFAHPTILKLYDSGSSGSGYGLISTSSTSPTTITNSVSNGTPITRYLGLFVSNSNGSFTGNDTATLTYTITVQ